MEGIISTVIKKGGVMSVNIQSILLMALASYHAQKITKMFPIKNTPVIADSDPRA